ncbi:hypothetical protein [Streptacidiphilus rugosus]|uniref:hypothetical protein n=1 Tax=Streptacidiphilus rugosus TaxID=405783 RepID=UPI00068C9970|nr:hypothetical protein [Streptacidiphilus rugosus]
MTTALNSLTIEIRTSEERQAGGVSRMGAAVHPMIDGRDIVAEAFDPGPGHAPERLLSAKGPLRAGDAPHEVELAEAECTWGCCGALCVTVRREGDQVVWGGWRDRNGPPPALPDFRFDARAYDAEVARAEADHSWEWPARTTARLLRDWLRARPGLLERWQFQISQISSWKRDEIDVLLFHPHRPTASDEPWLQFRSVLAVTDEDPSVQATRLGVELTEHDPRDHAVLCGGSADFARALGFAWPPPRG